jgi:hypothetical protein
MVKRDRCSVRSALVSAWQIGELMTACDHASVSLMTYLASPQSRSHRPCRAVYVATKPLESVADPSLCPELTGPEREREARCRRRARHRGGWVLRQRRTGYYMLIVDGTTETYLTLDDVENALFPPTEVMPTEVMPTEVMPTEVMPTEVMPTGLAPRLARPRKRCEMTVSQKLQVARNLVAQGWTGGALVSLGVDGRYKYCARGAINKAFLGRATSDAEFRPDDELRLAQRLVAEAMEGRFLIEPDPAAVRVAIRTWNDSLWGTTHAQARVVAAFDAAIDECKRLEAGAHQALAQ